MDATAQTHTRRFGMEKPKIETGIVCGEEISLANGPQFSKSFFKRHAALYFCFRNTVNVLGAVNVFGRAFWLDHCVEGINYLAFTIDNYGCELHYAVGFGVDTRGFKVDNRERDVTH